MSKDPNFPAMKWHPATGEMRVFTKADDVPEGWIDTHPCNITADAVGKAPTAPTSNLSMKRKQVVRALTDGGIDFAADASHADLYALLVEKLQATLTEAEIAFDPAADAAALLELLPKPE